MTADLERADADVVVGRRHRAVVGFHAGRGAWIGAVVSEHPQTLAACRVADVVAALHGVLHRLEGALGGRRGAELKAVRAAVLRRARVTVVAIGASPAVECAAATVADRAAVRARRGTRGRDTAAATAAI